MLLVSYESVLQQDSFSSSKMTISISESTHRLSPSLTKLSLDNLSQQQRLPPSFGESSHVPGISLATSTLVLRERRSGVQQPVTTSSVKDKRTKRRARSSFGGTVAEFVNGLDFAAGASQPEENKAVPGLNANGSGRAASVQSPLAKRTAASPAKEKNGMVKSGASSFQSLRLERSSSERSPTRIVSRIPPLAEGSLPRPPQPINTTQYNLSNGRSDNDACIVGEPKKAKQEEEAEPHTLDHSRPSERPAAPDFTAVIPRERCSSQAMQQRTLQQQQQQNATTSCQADSTARAQGMQYADFIRHNKVEQKVATSMENPSTVHIEESEMGMEMEKPSTSGLDADQKLKSNANETVAFTLHSVELPSSICQQEPSLAAAMSKLKHSIAFGASKSSLQKLNESTSGDCYVSFPTPSLRQALDTSNILDPLLKHGPQEELKRESSSEPEANEERSSSATAQELFYVPSIPFSSLGSESSRTLEDVHEKLSATTDNSSSSSRWTSATMESLSLPDPEQEQSVSSSTGPGINEEILNLNTQHVPLIAEKVTEEQLTEAAFLSNLGYSNQTIRWATSEDVHQTHASSTNRTNAFRSKSTGTHNAKPSVREDPGSAAAYSNSEQEVKFVSASSAANHLPLHTHGKIHKQDAGNAVLTRTFKKIKTSQTPMLLDTSAFPRGTAMWSRLSSETPEGVVSLHRMNADQIKNLFGHRIDLGVSPMITTATVLAKNGMQSKTKLMDALAECQQKKADFMNPRLGLVQAMTSNHFSKLAPSMAKSTFEGMVTLTNEKSQSIREMLLVSPHQSLEEYHHQGPSSISILGNPSFSSSQKDRLWEEQAEAYSSGGRGTPGHEDNNSTAQAFLAPRPGTTVSGVVFPSASGSLRKVLSDATVVPSTPDIYNEKGKTHNGKRRVKKKSKSHTPLQSLLAEEIQAKDTRRHSADRSSSPNANPCTKQFMLRIRGIASKSSSPKSHQQTAPHRSSFWSSCICFSPLK